MLERHSLLVGSVRIFTSTKIRLESERSCRNPTITALQPRLASHEDGVVPGTWVSRVCAEAKGPWNSSPPFHGKYLRSTLQKPTCPFLAWLGYISVELKVHSSCPYIRTGAGGVEIQFNDPLSSRSSLFNANCGVI